MISESEFTKLYSLYEEWARSQESQTDGYEYERSFASFVEKMNAELLNQTTKPFSSTEGTDRSPSKKK